MLLFAIAPNHPSNRFRACPTIRSVDASMAATGNWLSPPTELPPWTMTPTEQARTWREPDLSTVREG
jgi:hypothetical protein